MVIMFKINSNMKNDNLKINPRKLAFVNIIVVIFVGTVSACDVFTQISQNETENELGTGIPLRLTQTMSSEVVTSPEAMIPQPTDTPSPTSTITPSAIELFATESDVMFQPEVLGSGSEYQYNIQTGSPVYLPNIFHPESGCNWLGVAGQVFGDNTEPVVNIVVEAGGVIEGEPVFGLSLTGLAPDYGKGGYEIILADQAVSSQNMVWIQLFDLSGNAISPQIYFDTFDACDKNLVLVNFTPYASGAGIELFLPFVGKLDSP
jgi:hypothetical protein